MTAVVVVLAAALLARKANGLGADEAAVVTAIPVVQIDLGFQLVGPFPSVGQDPPLAVLAAPAAVSVVVVLLVLDRGGESGDADPLALLPGGRQAIAAVALY